MTHCLIHGDALGIGAHVRPGTVDLAYLDPPFKVEKTFNARGEKGTRAKGEVAYDDRWDSLASYLAWLEERINAVRELLSAEGSMWLHLDARAVHEAKSVCDRVFGPKRFRGEIIWVPGNGSKTRLRPSLGHQTLLLYARNATAIWNADDPVLREPFAATSQSMHFQRTDDAGRHYRDRIVNGKTYRYYADEGRALGSVWSDCPAMLANSPLRSETTGYPTQKPLKLLDRIVRATSHPESLVVDPFCGSGSTLVAAALAGRRFVGSDIGELAIATTRKRLDDADIRYTFVEKEAAQRPASGAAAHHASRSTKARSDINA